MFQICRDVEAVGFPVQNVYKMTYGDENPTFEPLNLWTRERLLIKLITISFYKILSTKIEAEMNLTELDYFPYVKKLCSEIYIVPRLRT